MQDQEYSASISFQSLESNQAKRIDKDALEKILTGSNPSQQNAIAWNKKSHLLVLAGAGTGKTTVLTKRVLYLLNQNVPAEEILALTFTQAAAKEMHSRIKKAMQTTLQKSSPNANLLSIHTFHAFALKLLLETNAGVPNWQRLGFSQAPKVTTEAAEMHWLKLQQKKFPFTLNELSQCLNGSDFQLTDSDAQKLKRYYQNFLQSTGQISFGEMVTFATKLFAIEALAPLLQNRFQYILVDEFQDTNPEQMAFVYRLLNAQTHLFLVGDDDQAIYGFRGAGEENFTDLLKKFPDLGIQKLELNYRSAPPILRFANSIMQGKTKELHKILIPVKKGGLPVQFKYHPRAVEQGLWMVKELQLLHTQQKIAWTHFAILYRLHALRPFYFDLITKYLGSEAANEIHFLTVHAAKGLEFPVVFFVGLEEGLCPYHERGEKKNVRHYAEERRIFYVGVTRAMSLLYLCSCKCRTLHGKTKILSSSSFLPNRMLRLKFKVFDFIVSLKKKD